MKTTRTRAAKLSVNRTKFRQVLDCGDGVFRVAALGRGGSVGDEHRGLERGESQSGDFADSVTALQDAVAPNQTRVIPQSSKLSTLLLILSTVTSASFLLLCPTSAHAQAGVLLWTNVYRGPSWGVAVIAKIAVDSGENVFVTGSSGNDTTSQRNADYATIAYSNSGEPLWEDRYAGPDVRNWAWAQAIAVDPSGNVLVTGWADASDDHAYYTTIKYSSSVSPPVQLDFQKLNNELVLNWTNAGFNLQTAPALTGPFTNLPAATSPYTNPLTAPHQFFRLISN